MKIVDMNVDYVDHMGSDLTVVNAARVSFDKESDWETYLNSKNNVGTKLSERDSKLISYLAKHNHWSPFAHTSVQFRIKAPIFVARQLVKHQVGGVWNEVSRRYVDSEPEFYIPKHVWRLRAENKKQGSADEYVDEDTSVFVQTDVEKLTQQCLATYEFMLNCKIAPEQARMILPQNTMTEWYWTGSLMFFARVCKQRLDPHAQQETREIAELINTHMQKLFPVSWAALMEN